jgi:hypothetical protein
MCPGTSSFWELTIATMGFSISSIVLPMAWKNMYLHLTRSLLIPQTSYHLELCSRIKGAVIYYAYILSEIVKQALQQLGELRLKDVKEPGERRCP